MINSVNTFDIIEPNLLNMEKFSGTTARLHHAPQLGNAAVKTTTTTYITFAANSSAIDIRPTSKLAELQQQQPRQERVKVQPLQSHTKLRNNNCWNNFCTLYNRSASSTAAKNAQHDGGDLADVGDVNAKQQRHGIDIQTPSAFNTEQFKPHINNSNKNTDSKPISNNNLVIQKVKQPVQLNAQAQSVMILMPAVTSHRTQDQEHAYRRIESVHNYAKLKAYDDEEQELSPNGSRNSSFTGDDEEEDDDDDDDEEDNEEDNDNDMDYEVEDYENLFKQRRLSKSAKSAVPNGPVASEDFRKTFKRERTVETVVAAQNEDDIDVETVDGQSCGVASKFPAAGPGLLGGAADESAIAKPDHHARRPMNAFLIFCKRHRAIVKDRYKNLENRAITKILGDWWASLDANDKKCFTNLAQQNKDAFFSANPNFKWYKLPAPPLRTLNTRPGNSGSTGSECDDSHFLNGDYESISNHTRSNTNYFKLADEAQMGELSLLMDDKTKTMQCALQQALGETSQYMSAHLTTNTEANGLNRSRGAQQLKRQLLSENSFSSNSSEEDGMAPKKKSARTCKGKIYQELISSGQIAAPAVKKSKSGQRLVYEQNASCGFDVLATKQKQGMMGPNECSTICNGAGGDNGGMLAHRRNDSESENMYSFEVAGFDLEEKIKELPALCLDEYLQRKRNTKKKKKFSNGKKRGGARNNNNHNNNNNSSSHNNNMAAARDTTSQTISSVPASNDLRLQQQRQQQQQAVGSQKRKARKESITRRDVSAIEQEVASLLPLTINGCCYFQEAPMPGSGAAKHKDNLHSDCDSFKPTSPIIPLITPSTTMRSSLSCSSSASSTASSMSPCSPVQGGGTVAPHNATINDNMTSTSDLLILAEVASNRTELKH